MLRQVRPSGDYLLESGVVLRRFGARSGRILDSSNRGVFRKSFICKDLSIFVERFKSSRPDFLLKNEYASFLSWNAVSPAADKS